MKDLTRVMAATIEAESMLAPDDRVVVGFSGGRDSSLLLSLLRLLAPSWRLSITVAHLNHGLRGPESDADERFVRDHCARLHVPLIVDHAPPAPFANLEEWAREVRYRFLAQVADRVGAAKIAVGHTADDAAETLLLNLIRGAGPAGLAALAPVRTLETEWGPMTLVRPLIRVSRRDYPDWLQPGVSYIEDHSNLDPSFARNRLRHELIPLLETFNPKVADRLAALAEVLRQQDRYLRGQAERFLEANAAVGPATDIGVALAGFKREAPALRLEVLRAMVRAAKGDLRRVSARQLEAIDRLALAGPPRWELSLPGAQARLEYGRLSIAALSADDARAGRRPAASRPAGLDDRVELPTPGRVAWIGPRGVAIEVVAAWVPAVGEPPDPAVAAWLSPAHLRPPLSLTARRPGDRYRPFGLTGSRKLKDVFNQLRVPPHDRDRYPLLRDRERILWVPGLRPADKLDPGETEALAVSLDPSPARPPLQ